MRVSRTPYTCGAIINVVVGAATSSRGGLPAFWRALFATADPGERRYDSARYFAVVDSATGDPRLAAFLRRWLRDTIPGVADTLMTELSRTGMEVEVAEAPPDRAAGALIRDLASALMAHDCGGRFSVSSVTEGLRFHGVPGCTTLPENGVMVTAAESISLGENPGAAYAAVAARCARNEPVRLAGPDRSEPLALACSTSVPRYLRILWVPEAIGR